MTVQELINALEEIKTIFKNEEIKVDIEDATTYYGSVEILGISITSLGDIVINTKEFKK